MENDWEVPIESIKVDWKKSIGRGQFGNVYRARWRGTKVAVKFFSGVEEKMYLIRKEFEIMTKLHHPNIIQLLGYTADPFSIVMEYVPNGSLETHKPQNTRMALRYFKDIARGLAYLHHRKPAMIIHRDLKPSNLLITKDYRIIIADFGVSRIVNSMASHPSMLQLTHNVGTPRYMAPEMYDKKAVYSTKVDIWSFGLAMYEILEDDKPFSSLSLTNFKQTIDRGYRPSFYKTPRCFRPIIRACWRLDDSRRPTALQILNTLDTIHPILGLFFMV